MVESLVEKTVLWFVRSSLTIEYLSKVIIEFSTTIVLQFPENVDSDSI